ncbi:MAG TPA: hypothetical protein VIT65_13870 [Microlunatus sp.]
MEMTENHCRDIVAQRSGGRCEAVIDYVCTGIAESMHHRRKHGRVWKPSNVIHVCGSGTTGCHGWIEAHPEKAHSLGLWLWDYEDPDAESIKMRWEHARAWWWLDDEGLLHYDESAFEPIIYSLSAPVRLTEYTTKDPR